MFSTTWNDYLRAQLAWERQGGTGEVPEAKVNEVTRSRVAPKTETQYAEVNGVTVDLASPEYAAWWREHYG